MRFEARSSNETDQHGNPVVIIVDTATGKHVPKRRFTVEALAIQEAEHLSATVKEVYNISQKQAQAA